MIVSVLATFNIRMAQDQDGRDIIPSKKVTSSAIMYPEPFEFKLTPRSEKHKELVRSAV
ncbi:hypothetical protein BDV93DRAFT_529058 [Ceratobasidium sp. AG-I]|nr:hypothetical protein BDV93DRAFT_529058 [Ceratobasidium sp. AG-I]